MNIELDMYDDFQVPIEDIKITLKVIRTIREMCLKTRDNNSAQLLSDTHRRILNVVEICERRSFSRIKDEDKKSS